MGLASCITASCLASQNSLTDSCVERCNSNTGWAAPLTTAEKVVYGIAVALLVLLTTVIACMMGSTLGIDMLTLQAGMQGSDPAVRRKSRRVVRLRSIGGSLLFSALLVTTVATHVAVAVLLTELLGAVGGLFVAFALILVFAEILPPAFCSTNALEIAWSTAWLASLLLVILFPLAWPVSVLLDRLIVHDRSPSSLVQWCVPCSRGGGSASEQTLPDTAAFSEDDRDAYTSARYAESGKLTSGGTGSLPSSASPYLVPQRHAEREREREGESGKSQSTSSTPPIAQVLDPSLYPAELTTSAPVASLPLSLPRGGGGGGGGGREDSNASSSRRDDPHEMTFKDLVDPRERERERVGEEEGKGRTGGREGRERREEGSSSSSHSHSVSHQSHSRHAKSSASTDSASERERERERASRSKDVASRELLERRAHGRSEQALSHSPQLPLMGRTVAVGASGIRGGIAAESGAQLSPSPLRSSERLKRAGEGEGEGEGEGGRWRSIATERTKLRNEVEREEGGGSSGSRRGRPPESLETEALMDVDTRNDRGNAGGRERRIGPFSDVEFPRSKSGF